MTLEGLKTSAIEGENLDPKAVRSSLARRLGLPTGGSSRPSRSVEGLAEVLLDATQKHDQALTLKRLCGWQAALFPTGRSGLHEIRVGKLRRKAPMRIVSGPVGRERVHYEAPPHGRLAAEVRAFLDWFNKPPAGLDGLIRAGIAHAWFEIVHPFEDGNGRVGRALLDITPWLAWFLAQMAAAIRSSESIVEAVLTRTRFWMKHSRTEVNERQLKALGRMLDTLPQEFVGGMTNKKYAHLTGASPATAQRDLAALVSNGYLVLRGAGRSARYELAS